jgi:hypothetical protein
MAILTCLKALVTSIRGSAGVAAGPSWSNKKCLVFKVQIFSNVMVYPQKKL